MEVTGVEASVTRAAGAERAAEIEVDGVDYVVGVDAGGTSTRALAIGLDGGLLGRGTAGGANPNSHAYPVAAARIAEAMSAAVAGLSPGRARGCVVGMAGSSKLTDPSVAGQFRAAWREVLPCDVRVVTDQEVAFASATPEPDGAVVVAGTGSIAAKIVDRELVATVGGYGWLLGDEGSAYWIGREAVRATLHALSAGEPCGPLARAVLAEALGGMDGTPEGAAGEPDGFAARHTTFSRLITAANAEQPIRLARFAPLVSAAAPGDPVAEEIVARTVDVLAEMAEAARTPGTPVVLVGSVAGPDGPVGARLRERLGQVLFAADAAAGAAWLAALDVLGPGAPRPRVAQAGVVGG
jgi:N-acetylglucosamine kinase-like BadF-type ATPase